MATRRRRPQHKEPDVNEFMNILREQRWDDHRFYHHSRINQSLHLISALSFLVAYALLFVEPAWAGLVGWCVAMVTRQTGHYVFEPRGFDQVNQVTDEYKEEIKVGYNMKRKTVLLTAWVLLPAALWFAPSLGGMIDPAQDVYEWLHDVGIAWLALGLAGLVFRVVQLWLRDGWMPALAWGTKIITDPVHDVMLYHKAPLALLRGELLDPMIHARKD
jgi:hypothetical protein